MFEEGDGFRAQIRLRTPEYPDGKNFRKRCATYAEAAAWLDDLISEWRGSGALPQRGNNASVTLGEWSDLWLERKVAAGKIAPRTHALYEGTIRNWIKPPLGHIAVNNLRRPDIQRFLRRLETEPDGRGKPMTWTTRHGQWRSLRTILNAAVVEGIIPRTPLHPDDVPHRPRDERAITKRDRVLPPTPLAQVMSAAMSTRWACSVVNHTEGRCGLGWRLRATTGIRQGEALAVLVGDLTFTRDDETREITGARMRLHQHSEQVKYAHGCGDPDALGAYPCGHRRGGECPRRHSGGMKAIPGLKSRADGERNLNLDADLAQAIDAHIAVLRQERMGRATHYLLGRGTKIITPTADRRRWNALLNAAGVEAEWDIHSLRHTAISAVVNAGLPIFAAQQLAGHADVKTTQGYITPDGEGTTAPVALMSRLLAALASQGISPEEIALLAADANDTEAPEAGRALHRAATTPTSAGDDRPWD